MSGIKPKQIRAGMQILALTFTHPDMIVEIEKALSTRVSDPSTYRKNLATVFLDHLKTMEDPSEPEIA